MNGQRPEDAIGDLVLADIALRLSRLQRGSSAEQLAKRLLVIADTLSLSGGRPPADLFAIAAAVCIAGIAACAVRDLAAPRPTPAVTTG
jgi:hypothetical protein